MKAKSLITALFFIALTSLLSAQDQSATREQGNVEVQGAYTDKNKDGICDTYEEYGPARGNVRGVYYGRGACYGRGNGFRGGRPAISGDGGYRRGLPQGQGRGFGPAYGRGLGPGQGRGLAPGGRRFVDADKNGMCDAYETTVQKK